MTMVELDLQYAEQSEEPPSKEDFQQWADLALVDDKSVEISIRIVDEEESQLLNKQYRSKDKPTNVLSFPMEIPEELLNKLDVIMLGDLVICAPIVEKEAKSQGKEPNAHWAHMVIHGILHLQGFDHVLESDAQEMESLEIKLLQQIGIENPYMDLH